ncbi:MAG TPA: hypothetical protein VFL57_02495, partial [Bryobacteraceae bacterium]|nr:hypothetical protein [Bryobacteraceae bacterium]
MERRAVPAPLPAETSGAFVPPPARLKPGERLSGFAFTSVLPPGAVRLLVEAVSPPLDAGGRPIVAAGREELEALAEAAGEELAERGCNVASTNQAIALNTQGPADTITVRIMIKPDQPPPAPIGPRSQGVIPVAILPTDSFDPGTGDVATVTFGAGAATSRHNSIEDVNGDHKADLVLHFDAAQIGVRCQDQS